jgi:hypothetical protein
MSRLQEYSTVCPSVQLRFTVLHKKENVQLRVVLYDRERFYLRT